MKKLTFSLLLIIFCITANAQRKRVDSLQRVISLASNDSTMVKAYFDLAEQYMFFKPDSGIIMAQRSYALAVAIKNSPYQRRSLVLLANLYVGLGNYTKAMKLYYDCLRLAENNHDDYAIIQTYNNIGSTYIQMPDYPKAFLYLRQAQQKLAPYISPSSKNIPFKFKKIDIYILNNFGEAFLFTDKLDSAAYYINKGIKDQSTYQFDDLRPVFISDLGILESKKGNKAAALNYLHKAEKAWVTIKDLTNLDLLYFQYAKVYKKFNQPDSAIFYAQKALSSAAEANFLADEAAAAKLLYELYDAKQNIPLAYKYYKTATRINDSLINKDKIRELASMDFEQKQHEGELTAAKLAYQNTIRNYLFAAGLALLALLAVIFWRNAQHRKQANKVLQDQKEEIEATLEQLQSAQAQLIQSEKMASLGELTAGIAHEIQNPLNFVNNFSDLNLEMLEELKAENRKPKAEQDEQLETDLINDLIENELKINHHGKRADSIVKGMLEHSRSATGQKESIDINQLAHEYLRLSYHGLRAKNKSFNAELVTQFDEDLPKINAIPQDIARVLLNLFNNAFYAVNQKAKTAGPDYKPTVEVSTAQQNDSIMIIVKDNGNGIPEALKDKIMQPFFTTKPTGEGTGLGLSLSYDIVVKGHGGKITVDSRENQYSVFIITIPLS